MTRAFPQCARHPKFGLLALAIVFFILTLPALLHPVEEIWTWRFSSPFSPRPRGRKLHHLLPINSAGAGPLFCKVLMSSLVHGYAPIILNWEAEGDGSYMQRMKVLGVHEWLQNPTANLEDDDVVFMMDAWDVWLQLPPEVLLERYAEYPRDVVVIGADKGCWPNDWDSPACRDVPESPVPKIAYSEWTMEVSEVFNEERPRWANSGTVIGTVRSMKTIYQDLVSRLPETAATDQGIFNEFLNEGRITLDYWSRLFWVNAGNVEAGTIINTRHPVSTVKSDAIPYHLLPPMLYHSQTGEHPVAIHFNDHLHKNLMDDWWGRLWWTRPDFAPVWKARLENGAVRFAHNGSGVRWQDLCNDILWQQHE